MLERERAPSQAVTDPIEVALSTWLSRWAAQDALERLRNKATRAALVKQLDHLAQLLRSGRQDEREAALHQLSQAHKHPVFELLAMLWKCNGCDGWATDAWISSAIGRRERFWPTWLQWTEWVSEDGKRRR